MNSVTATQRPLRKAVILGAGVGTRVLPATKAMPEKTLSMFDRRAPWTVADEIQSTSTGQIVVVTGRNKGAIEDYFARTYERELILGRARKLAPLSMRPAVLRS